MLLTFTSARQFQNCHNTMKVKLPIQPKKIVFGRGDKLLEICQDHSHPIDLSTLDSSISRVHGQLTLSPTWFNPQWSFKFLRKIFGGKIPQDILDQIYNFLKPRKDCILKDLESRMGMYQKVIHTNIESGIQLGFGDNRIIEFLEELIIKKDQIHQTLSAYKSEGWQIKGSTKCIENIYILKLRCENINYILLGEEEALYKIGRSAPAHIILNHSSISRKQAIIQFKKGKWKLKDGNGQTQSINGTWRRFKKIKINPSQVTCVKVGQTILQINFDQIQ